MVQARTVLRVGCAEKRLAIMILLRHADTAQIRRTSGVAILLSLAPCMVFLLRIE